MPNSKHKEQSTLEECLPSNQSPTDDSQEKELCLKLEDILAAGNSKEHIVKSFAQTKWNKMDEDERLILCQKLENNLASESHRAPYWVIRTNQLTHGFTNKADKTISINVNQVNSYEVLDTLVHESHHANQFDLIDKREKALGDRRAMAEFKEELEQKGFSETDVMVIGWELYNYVSARDSEAQAQSLKLYDMQILETDAVFKATKFLHTYGHYLDDDSDFARFVKAKDKEVETLRGLFKEEKSVKLWFEDRIERVAGTDETKFSKPERDQLEAIFKLKDINDCGFKVISNLQSWENSTKKAAVERVTLNEVMGTERVRKRLQRSKILTKMPSISEKRPSSGFGHMK